MTSSTGATEAQGQGQQDAWTVQKVLQWSLGYLTERGSETPRLDAELLLSQSLGLTRIQLYTNYDKPLIAEERESFRGLLRRRGAGEPVAYIIGTKDFMGLPFAVSKAVLIPRPDTEVLVEAALKRAAARTESDAPLAVLDIGTGSGCIAVALAARLPQADVEAWDLDEEALAVAMSNAARHAADRVRLRRNDALDSTAWEAIPDGSLDMVVSNPPYIAASERPSLSRSVVDYEPQQALFAEENGLAFYRAFAERARAKLREGGALLVEIGATQADDVRALLEAAGWRSIKVLKDYERRDRVVVAEP